MMANDPRHGTSEGYMEHRRRKERVCDACRAAVPKETAPRYDECACGRRKKIKSEMCFRCHYDKLRRDANERRVLDGEGRWTEDQLDPVAEWVKVRSPSGHIILRRAS